MNTALTPRPVKLAAAGVGLIVAVALAAAVQGCDPVPAAKIAGRAVVDCTKANQAELGALLDEFKTLLRGEVPDWGAVKARAIAAGQAIGGCALATIVAQLSADTAATSFTGANATGARARAVFEEYRDQHAGGATYRLATGEL